ncbi:hypothetical protein GCM10007977_079430 [Dactylosporangium sucinum]|uniref:Uncharacterized protein n=1 Tax=Dactylosporangium sucinum TaxID=1424081 RepID=A0A917UA44_9ACTN|nr:hypothetical protein GCM10007977_079430 [Dactylosporangium sucinum]
MLDNHAQRDRDGRSNEPPWTSRSFKTAANACPNTVPAQRRNTRTSRESGTSGFAVAAAIRWRCSRSHPSTAVVARLSSE